MAQLAFEVFNVTGLFIADEPVLALYSVGKSSGLVVDIGHDTTGVSLGNLIPSDMPSKHTSAPSICFGFPPLSFLSIARRYASPAYTQHLAS
jgi:hypothetical protein